MELPVLVKEHQLDPQKALEQLWGRELAGQGAGPGQASPDFGLMMERDVKRQEQGEPWLIDFGLRAHN